MKTISRQTLQAVCKKVEKEMIRFLLHYTPPLSDNLQLGAVETIARFARDQAFKAFDEACTVEDE